MVSLLPQGWHSALGAFLAGPSDANPPTAARDQAGRLTAISADDLITHVLMLEPRQFDKRRQMETAKAMRVAGYEPFRPYVDGCRKRWWRLRA
jgi:hypothetical protein